MEKIKKIGKTEANKEKITKMAVKIIEELTKEEQIALICSFASMLIDELGDGEKFFIVKENIKTKEKYKMTFSNEKI